MQCDVAGPKWLVCLFKLEQLKFLRHFWENFSTFICILSDTNFKKSKPLLIIESNWTIYHTASPLSAILLWVIVMSQRRANEFLPLIKRMSPKLRKTKRISRFYKSDFDISPIETKIRNPEPVIQSESDIQHNFKISLKNSKVNIILFFKYLNHVVTHFRNIFFVTKMSLFRHDFEIFKWWDIDNRL